MANKIAIISGIILFLIGVFLYSSSPATDSVDDTMNDVEGDTIVEPRRN